VLGASGEPFLRIAPGGVDANLRSGTWQRSARAAAESDVPYSASDAAGETALWRRVASTARFGWVEPRALSQSWQVPMQLGERRFVVTGGVSSRPFSDVAQSSGSPGL
jgi:hypothetical protein